MCETKLLNGMNQISFLAKYKNRCKPKFQQIGLSNLTLNTSFIPNLEITIFLKFF